MTVVRQVTGHVSHVASIVDCAVTFLLDPRWSRCAVEGIPQTRPPHASDKCNTVELVMVSKHMRDPPAVRGGVQIMSQSPGLQRGRDRFKNRRQQQGRDQFDKYAYSVSQIARSWYKVLRMASIDSRKRPTTCKDASTTAYTHSEGILGACGRGQFLVLFVLAKGCVRV